MSRPLQVRYPLAPLASFVDPAHQMGQPALAKALGLHLKQLQRYAAHGVTDIAADRLACRAGAHPALIWPEWIHAGVA
jgi:hypothetical protein